MNVAADILAAGTGAATALRLRAETSREDVTYDELRERVHQVAAALRNAGVVEEQRVLLVLPDSLEFVYAFLGAIWIGAVPVPVNPFLRTADYEFFLSDTRARVVVAAAGVLKPLEAGLAALPRRPLVWSVAPDRGGSFWTEIARASGGAVPFGAHTEDAAFWLYSSGTTGHPKGTIHLHRNIPFSVDSYGRTVLATTPADIAYATSKLFFAYGLGASLYFPLAAGAAVVLSPEPFDPARTWKLLAEERPSLFFAVPSTYRALLNQAPTDAGRVLAGARRCLSAGEGLPPTVFEEWKGRTGKEILDGIGSTELLHIYLSNLPGDAVAGTLGRPLPGYTIEIVDEDGRPVRDGEIGVMRVRGGSLASGYWHGIEATRRSFDGDGYWTGDQARRGADGRYRVVGRADDMFKVSGQWVAPSDVEAVIAAVAGVADCGVVGRSAAHGLVELVACVTAPAVDEAALQIAIHAACAAALPRFKRPKEIRFLAQLPRTATGKLQRFLLREEVARPPQQQRT